MTHHHQVGFIWGMQGWYNIYKLVNANHQVNNKKVKTNDFPNRCRARWTKPSITLRPKKLSKMGRTETFSQLNTYRLYTTNPKPTAYLTVKEFLLRAGTRQGYLFLLLFLNIDLQKF